MQLSPEQANLVWEALNAALDAGRDVGTNASAETSTSETLQAERADAMTSVAQTYLQHEPRTLGRARRTIPSAIGRALWLRDGGCRVPGCGRKHHLHAHHIEAWAEGGKTSQSNLVLLCPSHHGLVHEGLLFVDVREGKMEFRTARGTQIQPNPDRDGDFEAIEHWLHSADPGFDRDGTPRWDGSRFDLDEVLSWMWTSESTRPRERR
ncbi:HNH endonuclease signature motif containing protein [Nannocystaceae bacterium ST9]